MSPKIKSIERLKESNNIPTDEIQKLKLQLQKAEEIVNRCSKIAWWNYCKKHKYSKMLVELDVSLRKIFGNEVQVEIWEDVMMLMVEIKEGNKKLDDLFKRNGCISIFSQGGNTVLFVVSGLKRHVQYMLKLIIPYLSSFMPFRRLGYQRITAGFCPNLWKSE